MFCNPKDSSKSIFMVIDTKRKWSLKFKSWQKTTYFHANSKDTMPLTLVILLVNSEASRELDITEWFKSSPIALIGFSALKI